MVVHKGFRRLTGRIAFFLAMVAMIIFAAACGGETVVERVVETVIVTEKGDTVVERVVETVIVTEKGDTQTIEVVVTATSAPVAPVEVAGDIPAPQSPSGTLMFAMLDVGKGVGINSAGSGNYRWGITETPFMTNFPGDVVGMVIDSWERKGDELFLTVKEGIEFHGGWGPFTAHDLAWNLDDTNTNTNETSISSNAGDYGALFLAHEAIDDKTVKVTINNWDVRWRANQLNNQGQTMEIFSKKAFDDNDREWMVSNIIGTGPFEVVEFKDDDRIVVDAVQNHWRKTPETDRITYLEVPEAATRKAMMLNGQADAAELILPDRKDLRDRGFTWVSANSGKEQVVIFGGNYWEETSADTGEDINPWDLAGYETDIPWVGCPWEDKCPYTDTDNPAGMDDMEQARLVRWAMAMAYDRDLINETIFAGQASPDHISMFIPTLPEFKDEWKIEFNPEKAEEYLDMAGFPRGSDGTRFKHRFITFAGFGEEILHAVAGFWENIGIETESQIVDYGGVFRPTVVDRSNSVVYIQGCRHHNGLPFDWPRGAQNTTLTRGGFGCGIEMPWIAEAFLETNKRDDPAERIALNTEVAEKMFFWMPQSGIAVVPNGMIVNPRSIANWQMRDGFESPNFQGPELIELASR